MRVDKKTHLNRRWRVDEIAGDFHLWDVWEFSTLAVYTKPRGFAGRMYLKLVEPFRHYLVYPTLLKAVKKEWESCRSEAR